MSGENELRRLLAHQGIGRREFMERAAALGVSSALATSLAGRAFAATPKKGGDLKLGIDSAGATDSLDPATYTANYMQTVGYQWGNPLVELDEHNDHPRARRELGAERRCHPVGVQAQQGRPVQQRQGDDAQGRHLLDQSPPRRGFEIGRPGLAAGDQGPQGERPERAHRALSDAGNADLPYIIVRLHSWIVPEGTDYDKPASAPGLHPRNLRAWRAHARQAQPELLEAEGRGLVDSVETLAINDLTARTSALQTGAVHVINRVEPQDRRPAQAHAQDAGVRRPERRPLHLPDALRHRALRQQGSAARAQIRASIARDLVKQILRGYGKVGNDQPIADVDPFYAADIPQQPYDPDKAKAHFKKSGRDGTITLSIADVAFTGAVDAACCCKEHLAKAGIKIDVTREPADGYWDNVWTGQAVVRLLLGGGRPTADLMLSVVYQVRCAPGTRPSGSGPEFDKMLWQARAELDADKRKQMYHDLQMMIYDDGGEIIPMFNNFLFGARNNIGGFMPAPVLTGLRCAEQLYFTS